MSTIVLWVSDLEAQSDFYASLFDVDAPTVQGDFVSISSDLNTVLLHLLPSQYAAQTPLTSQLAANEEVPSSLYSRLIRLMRLCPGRATHSQVSDLILVNTVALAISM